MAIFCSRASGIKVIVVCNKLLSDRKQERKISLLYIHTHTHENDKGSIFVWNKFHLPAESLLIISIVSNFKHC